jgi:hypothetical protein
MLFVTKSGTCESEAVTAQFFLHTARACTFCVQDVWTSYTTYYAVWNNDVV